jgi:DNA-damage-inducible protein J
LKKRARQGCRSFGEPDLEIQTTPPVKLYCRQQNNALQFGQRKVLTMKDSTVSARVETNIKIEAEDILQKLGVPSSVVINSLYRQIIYHKGIPFSLTVPAEPETIDSMSEDRLDAKLSRSYAQSVAGEGRPVKDVFDDLERSLK